MKALPLKNLCCCLGAASVVIVVAVVCRRPLLFLFFFGCLYPRLSRFALDSGLLHSPDVLGIFLILINYPLSEKKQSKI